MPKNILIPLIVACALFMENMDSTVIATALPAIALDLGEDPVTLKLALTSYLITLAVFIPASGWTADRFGARKVFVCAIAVFTLGSVLCGLVESLHGFVAARALQGLGGAMMVPVGRLVLLRSVEKRELLSALAWLTVPGLIGPVIGPPVGGFITTFAHWRWIFWINVPIGFLGIALALAYIADRREENPRPFDTRGFILSGYGLAGLMFGLTAAGRGLVSPWIDAALIGTGMLALAAYVRHARRTPGAILDLTLLRIPTFRACVLGGSLFRIGIGAIPFLLTLMLQIGFGLTPFAAGSLTFAAAAGAMAMKFTAPPIIKRLGFRRVLMGNAIASAAFTAVIGLFTPTTFYPVILALLLIGGFMRSLQFTSLNALTFSDIEPADMGRATSFSGCAQQLAITLGVALAAALLEASRGARGGPLLTQDFPLAFFVVAAVSASSWLVFRRLGAGAGASVSGVG